MQISLELINKIFSDLRNPNTKYLTFIDKKVVHEITDPEGSQGDEGHFFMIYKIKELDELFLKVEYVTDSYGDGEAPVGAQIVKGVAKTVVVYELP